MYKTRHNLLLKSRLWLPTNYSSLRLQIIFLFFCRHFCFLFKISIASSKLASSSTDVLCFCDGERGEELVVKQVVICDESLCMLHFFSGVSSCCNSHLGFNPKISSSSASSESELCKPNNSAATLHASKRICDKFSIWKIWRIIWMKYEYSAHRFLHLSTQRAATMLITVGPYRLRL